MKLTTIFLGCFSKHVANSDHIVIVELGTLMSRTTTEIVYFILALFINSDARKS